MKKTLQIYALNACKLDWEENLFNFYVDSTAFRIKILINVTFDTSKRLCACVSVCVHAITRFLWRGLENVYHWPKLDWFSRYFYLISYYINEINPNNVWNKNYEIYIFHMSQMLMLKNPLFLNVDLKILYQQFLIFLGFTIKKKTSD